MQAPQHIVFPPFRLDLRDERVWRRDEAIRLSHKAFAVLRCLVRHPGQLVTKDDLLATVWPEGMVSEAALTTAVRELRLALGDQARTPHFIETVHGRGYRFIAPLTATCLPPLAPASTASPGASAAAPGWRPLSSIASAPNFVGRETEWERLHQWYTTARQGVRQVGFIAGEAGIGKTALIEAFVSRVAAAGDVWVGHGQCIEHYGAGEAYLPLLEALGRLGRSADGAPLVALLRSHAPSWFVHLPALLPPDEREALISMTHQSTPARMLRELADVLDVLTAQRPLILVLEDLHWSDTATLEWLAYVARRRDPARLLVLGTYRPVEVIVHPHPLRTVITELRPHPRCAELVLDYLSEAAVAAYLQQRCGSTARLVDLAQVLHRRTSGHPLFLVALVDELMRQRSVAAGDAAWCMHGGLDVVTEMLPTSVQQFIAQHVEQLSSADQALLEAASVAGNTFTVAAVAAGVSLPEEAIEARCTAWARQDRFLQAAGTETWPDGTVTACYRFRHGLYHEVVYGRVSAGQRVRLHQQIGARLEAGYGADAPALAAELAVHFTQGQDLQRAVAYLLQAAQNAIRRSAYPEARRHLTTGLALVPRLPQARDRAQHELRLSLPLGTVLMATQGWGAPAVEHIYLRARELCQQLGDTPHLCLALWGLIAVSVVRADLHKTRALSQELLGLAQGQHDPVFLVAAHMELAGAAFGGGELTLAREHFAHSAALYDPAQHRAHVTRVGADLGVFCRVWSTHPLWHLGYPDQARRRIHETLTLAQELSHPFSQAIALAYAAMLHQFRRDVQTAHELADAAMALCTEHGFTYYAAWAMIIQGWVGVVREQSEASLAQIRQGIEALQATGGSARLPYYRALLAEAYGSVGQIATGGHALTKAFVAMQNTGECWWEAELHRLQGELVLRQVPAGEQRAEVAFRQALAIARRQQARSLELRAAISLARLWQQQGKRVEARQLLAPIYGWFTEGSDTADLQEARALLAAWGAWPGRATERPQA
jgi:DNA-binding winged helix-turn-helix (wHTH) protein/predicted ATPase